MSRPRTDVFFYGLFMDVEVLHEHQVEALSPRRAHVNDFKLCIGQRATLVPSRGARAYGMVYSLSHAELERLYGTPGLDEYRAEGVLAHSATGESVPALCYNLPSAPGPDEANAEYAARLRETLARLRFPDDYIRSVS